MENQFDKELAKLILKDSLMSFDEIKNCVEETKNRAGRSNSSLSHVIVEKGYLPPTKVSSLLTEVKKKTVTPGGETQGATSKDTLVETTGDKSPTPVPEETSARLTGNRPPQANIDKTSPSPVKPPGAAEHKTSPGVAEKPTSPGTTGKQTSPPSDDSDKAMETNVTHFQNAMAAEFGESGRDHVQTRKHSPVTPLQVGDKIGDDIEIVDKLGQGGMGAVFLGYQDSLDRKVAIKVISPQVLSSQEVVERFALEAKTAAGISHPNIIQIHGIGEEKGQKYIVMEFVEGKSLVDIIEKEGILTAEEAVEITLQAAKGLAEAHRRGILHRDIKPDNIFIDNHRHVKIGDFGLAKNVAKSGITQTGAIMGTPHYMSPEQAEGFELDHRADIYSLGATLYHAMVGEAPFDGDTAVSVLFKHVHEKLRFPKETDAALDKRVRKMIEKMMAKEKIRRHRTSEELVAELEALLLDIKSGKSPKSVTIETEKAIGAIKKAASAVAGAPKKAVSTAVKPYLALENAVTSPDLPPERRKKIRILLLVGLGWCLVMAVVFTLMAMDIISLSSNDVATTKDKKEKNKEGKDKDKSPYIPTSKDKTSDSSNSAPLSVHTKISKLVAAKKFTAAMEVLEKSLIRYPDDIELSKREGYIREKEEEYKKVQTDIQKMIRAGESAYKRGSIPRALYYYDQAWKKSGDLKIQKRIREICVEAANKALKDKEFVRFVKFAREAISRGVPNSTWTGVVEKKIQDLAKAGDSSLHYGDPETAFSRYQSAYNLAHAFDFNSGPFKKRFKKVYLKMCSEAFDKKKTDQLAQLALRGNQFGRGDEDWFKTFLDKDKSSAEVSEKAVRLTYQPKLDGAKGDDQKHEKILGEYREKLRPIWKRRQEVLSELEGKMSGSKERRALVENYLKYVKQMIEDLENLGQ